MIELSINTAYVPSWNVLEGLRELVQNALDAQDQGFRMQLDYDVATRTVTIANAGAQLQRSSLLLGTTSKDGHTARGQFGEGYKLACLALLRAGCSVVIKTGTEVWEPQIGHSTTFNATVLQIHIPEQLSHPGVEICVNNVSLDIWLTMRERVLLLTPPSPADVITVGADALLLETHRRNMLFVRDLWIGTLPDNYRFGYALNDVQLDRDRRLADPWALRKAIKTVLLRAVQQGALRDEQLFNLIDTDCGEARAIEQEYIWSNPDALTDDVTRTFCRMHGDDAVPISNMSESLIAAQHGMKGVTVSRAVRRAVETQLGTFDDRKAKQQLAVAKTYNAHELTDAERNNFVRAFTLLTKAEPAHVSKDVHVVDFLDATICGMHHAGQVYIAKRLLVDRNELLATLVHEVCHDNGVDGSVAHTRAMEQLFARIVANTGAWQ